MATLRCIPSRDGVVPRWLVSLLKERLSGIRVVIVANREPYIHNRVEGPGSGASWIRPASGLVTALDTILRATGGVWIAHGSGSGDHETADERVQAVRAIDDACHCVGLFSEDIEPRTGMLLGNFPQAYIHVGLINTAVTISELLEARDARFRAWS